MKKASLILAVVALGFIGCDKALQDFTQFTIPVSYTQSVDINTGLPDSVKTVPSGGISLDFPKVGVATNRDQTLSANSTSKDKIISFKLGNVDMTMTQPSGANFDFIDSVRLYISTTSAKEVLIAHKYDIAKGQQTIKLDCDTSADFKEYFFADSLYIRMGAHIVGIPASGSKTDIKPTFNLTANPLK